MTGTVGEGGGEAYVARDTKRIGEGAWILCAPTTTLHLGLQHDNYCRYIIEGYYMMTIT